MPSEQHPSCWCSGLCLCSNSHVVGDQVISMSLCLCSASSCCSFHAAECMGKATQFSTGGARSSLLIATPVSLLELLLLCFVSAFVYAMLCTVGTPGTKVRSLLWSLSISRSRVDPGNALRLSLSPPSGALVNTWGCLVMPLWSIARQWRSGGSLPLCRRCIALMFILRLFAVH